MKKYKCPKCGKSSTSTEINKHVEKLLIDYYITWSHGFKFNEVDINSNYDFYCPHCNEKVSRKGFIEVGNS